MKVERLRGIKRVDRMRSDALVFAEKMIALLDEGSFNTTYKFAVIVAFLDLSVELLEESSDRVVSVTSGHLAEKVLEFYWRQSGDFEGGAPLMAGKSGQAEILTKVLQYRASPECRGQSLAACRRANGPGFQALERFVEWKLVEQPLPRLQKFGGHEDPFIYTIAWDSRIRESQFKAGQFDDRIRLRPGAVENLAVLNPLLRPLVYRKWAEFVAAANSERVKDSALEEYLFGAKRIPLEPVRNVLLEVQQGRCFFCPKKVQVDRAHVDHFIPWSRWPSNVIQNLVVADRDCNLAKKDYLPASQHLERWMKRNREQDEALSESAIELGWPSDKKRALGAASGIYRLLPSGAKLWVKAREFHDYAPTDFARAFGVGQVD